MTPAQMKRALLELQTIDQRVGDVEKAVMRATPERIEDEVRELARLMNASTRLLRQLYEHAWDIEECKVPVQAAPEVTNG